MRIATGLHSPLLGGSQIATVDLASHLRRRGHDVEMFVIEQEFNTSVLPLAAKAGFDVEVLPGEDSLVKQARHVRSFVDRHRSDVVHVYNEHSWLGALAALALWNRPGKAAVLTNWMMDDYRWVPPFAPLIVGFESLRQESQSVHRGPVVLLEPPVDTESNFFDANDRLSFRSKHGLGPTETVAVIISRIDRIMKLDSILRSIDAVGALAEPDLRLVIVGDGDAIDTASQRAKEVNQELGHEAVLVVGAMYDPRPAYSAADIVLGMGGSAIRALAFGKPVIVQGEGSFSLLFEPESVDYFHWNGFYGHADPDRPIDVLSDQIRVVLDPGKRAELGAFGLEVAQKRYSLDELAGRLEGIYEQALADPPSIARRTADVAYVSGRHLAHRIAPSSLKGAIRDRLGS